MTQNNLPDNVSHKDIDNLHKDNLWDTGVFDDRVFTCSNCSFELTGTELNYLELNYNSNGELSSTYSGSIVCACPNCIVWIRKNKKLMWSGCMNSPVSYLGHLLVPHICGVNIDCNCSEHD